jgi:TonB family protein
MLGAAYVGAPLKNPPNDVSALAQVLRKIGFEATQANDIGLRRMSELIDQFTTQLKPGDLGLFFYSGHGAQVQFENYLIPTDFSASSEADIKYTAYSADRLRAKMEESGARLRIIILDACRNNPFRATRGGSRGLAPMQTDAEGTLIAYATGDNNVADDNPAEPNGLFTKHLVAALQTPGLSQDEVFRKVKEDVYYASRRRQNPFTYDNVVGRFVLVPGPARPVAPAAADSGDAEVAQWNAIKESSNPRVFTAFLQRFPSGPIVELAKERLAQLPAAPAASEEKLRPSVSEIRVSPQQQQARLVRQDVPVYPPLAKHTRVRGTVRFYAIIGEDGKVEELEVVTGHPLLVTAAIDAVKRWEYKPALVNGRPAKVLTVIDVSFTLQ